MRLIKKKPGNTVHVSLQKCWMQKKLYFRGSMIEQEGTEGLDLDSRQEQSIE